MNHPSQSQPQIEKEEETTTRTAALLEVGTVDAAIAASAISSPKLPPFKGE